MASLLSGNSQSIKKSLRLITEGCEECLSQYVRLFFLPASNRQVKCNKPIQTFEYTSPRQAGTCGVIYMLKAYLLSSVGLAVFNCIMGVRHLCALRTDDAHPAPILFKQVSEQELQVHPTGCLVTSWMTPQHS